jgi:hypothetical protein
MPKRIIYIPRPRDEADKPDVPGHSLIKQASGWQNIVEGKEGKNYTFYLRCLGESLPGDGADGEADSQIYIYAGHGLTGVDGAGWPGDPGSTTNQVVVTSQQIADRISKEGWSPAVFKGKIKVYSCYSGAGNPSFGKMVADKMRLLHWENCSFFGYETQITQIYSKLMTMQAEGFAEKWDVPLESILGMHRWSVDKPGGIKVTSGRTSKARVPV